MSLDASVKTILDNPDILHCFTIPASTRKELAGLCYKTLADYGRWISRVIRRKHTPAERLQSLLNHPLHTPTIPEKYRMINLRRLRRHSFSVEEEKATLSKLSVFM